MRFESTPLPGSYLIHLNPHVDARGVFARTFCALEFAAHGLETVFVQANISTNTSAGTVRGMHFQREPHTETKLIRCVRGTIYDVIIDMRAGSKTFLQWFGTELSETNASMVYVPKGFAHGYQALSDAAAVFYLVSAFYAPAFEDGLRADDPKLQIKWPRAVSGLSDKDARWPLLGL